MRPFAAPSVALAFSQAAAAQTTLDGAGPGYDTGTGTSRLRSA